jgi:L-ribulose-5-phosphate 4-epimerase
VRAGLVALTFGNASEAARADGVMAIKPSGVPYDELTPQAIVVIDIATGDVVQGDRRPSSDAPTHLVLYRAFAAIGGVVHTHSPFATAWAQARRDLPCLGTTHADHFRGPIPVTRDLTPEETGTAYEARTGDVIVETLERRGIDPAEVPAALVGSHGPFTWGRDAAAAVESAIALEVVAELALRTSQLAATPPPAPIADSLLERHHARKHGPGAYYGQARR